jgi:hypothetical protein
VGSNTRQCQHHDGERKLPGHQPKNDPVVLMLFWEQELHFGGDFRTIAIKIDSISPKLTVEPKRLR